MDKEEDYYSLGYIGRFHGVRGEMNVKLDVDDPQEYINLKKVFVKAENNLVPYLVEKLALRKNNMAVVKLKGIDTANQAEEMTGREMFLPLSVLPKLSGNKFYYHEVTGFSVYDKAHGTIGPVEKVLDFPRQAILQVNYKGKEVLIPVADEIIVDVNRETRVIEVDLPEGLLDVYLT